MTNCDLSRIGHASPVGLFPRGSTPEPENIADLHGNVWEWISDWYGAGYEESEKTNSIEPKSGKMMSLRGGSWHNDTWQLRVSNPGIYHAGIRGNNIGFRCARTV